MKKKKLLLATLSLVALGTMTGCGKIPKLENGQEVVASIDGYQISANDLYAELKSKGGASILVDLIDTYIINKEVEDSKEATDYAESLLSQYKLSYEQQGQDFSAALLNAGYQSEDEFKKVLVKDYKSNQVVEKYLKEQVTDEELQKYYDEKISDELSVKHILIAPETKDDMTDEEKAAAEDAALAKANDMINQLNNGGDFDTLAKENSDDTASATNGGLINNVVKEGYVTEFWDAAYNLEVGKYTTAPVKTEYGYHVIFKVSHNNKASLEDMKDTLYSKIVDAKLQEDENLAMTTWKQIREKYNLNIVDSDMNNTYSDTIKTLK